MTQLFGPIPSEMLNNGGGSIQPSSSSAISISAVRQMEVTKDGQSNDGKSGDDFADKKQRQIQRMMEKRRQTEADDGNGRTRINAGGKMEEMKRRGRKEWEFNEDKRIEPIKRKRRRILLGELLAFSILMFIPFPVEGIRCYCTDEHCVPYGVCEANVCLVGLLRASNAVIRTCGNQPLGCQRNVDRWSHLCSCDDNFCNTFLFLKASTSIDGPKGRSESGINHRDSGDHRIFERVDPPPGEFATFDHNSGDDEPAPIKNSNLLTLLLVIVPLSVGAAAVVVVAINYYCHLC